ncbi:MAG: transcription termination factor NusA [Planctomycetota bacterium]
MNGELLRIIDSIHREKSIDKEIVFSGIESALASACKRHFGAEENVEVVVDRETGAITATEGGRAIDPEALGRIAAQTAKQVMIQKIREAERDVIYDEYEKRLGQLINGTVQRFEGRNIIVNLGRTEGILPVSEQIQTESYKVGERIQCVVLEVKKTGPRVRIVLSRTSPDLVRRLFEIEVPEIAERIIGVKAIAREAGHRTKIAVSSIDPRIDCVGACVGVRGTRIKSIVDEVNGEKIDIVRWNDSSEILIMNALKPAEIEKMILDEDIEPRKATVFVREDQLSLAIGKKGQNVRLASKLSKWDIDIVPSEETAPRASAEEVLGLVGEGERPTGRGKTGPVPGLADDVYRLLKGAGYGSRETILAAGIETLAKVPGMDEDKARHVVRTLVSQALEGVQLEEGTTPVEEPQAPEAAPTADEAAPPAPEEEQGPTREAAPEEPAVEDETKAEPEG